MSSTDTQLAFLRLTHLRGVGPVLIKRLLEALGSPQAILSAHPSTLAAVEGIGKIKANQIVTSVGASETPAREELARIHQFGCGLLTLADDRYPPALKTIPDPPLVLYVRGELLPEDTLAIGMVGARRCTLYGREQAQRIAAQLAQRGLTVVSGGARGIDTAAHLGALQAGGRTLVITGCGLCNTYPPENEGLYQRVVKEGRGAIISELPLQAPPVAENFPPRNRIIAGLTLGIVVVEANLQSGSLITARLAAADYGREVFALPGRVDSIASAGTHHLIKSATAHLVESADDILEHLGDVGRSLARVQADASCRSAASGGLFESPDSLPFPPQSGAPGDPPLTSRQQHILSVLGPDGVSIDDLVERTHLAPQLVMAELTMLQIHGKVRRMADNRFRLK